MRVINKIIIGTGLAFAAGFIGQKATAAEMGVSAYVVNQLVLPLEVPTKQQYGRVVSVQHNYAYVTTYIPRQQCRQAPDPGNVLLGIILGGVSGKVITGEDGGAAVGAIAGGLIASDNKRRVCTTVHEEVRTKVIDSYDITYTWNGYYGESRTSIPYQRGDEVLVNVSINLN